MDQIGWRLSICRQCVAGAGAGSMYLIPVSYLVAISIVSDADHLVSDGTVVQIRATRWRMNPFPTRIAKLRVTYSTFCGVRITWLDSVDHVPEAS